MSAVTPRDESRPSKQRCLTAQQRKLLELQQAGANDHAIADALGIHIGTVRLKRAALIKGIAKGSYSDIGDLSLSADTRTRDLFAEGGVA